MNLRPDLCLTLLTRKLCTLNLAADQCITAQIDISAKVYPKVSGLAAWSENCKWYSSLPLGAVVSLFYESV
jgi:hypothetical protein